MPRTPGLPNEPRIAPHLEPLIDATLDHDDEWTGVSGGGDLARIEAEDVEIHESSLVNLRLTGATLDRARISDVRFADCELSGTTLDEATLTRVEFRNCRMSGFVASRARLRDVRFVECRLDTASFRMAVTERIAFEDCDLVDADFYDAKLADGATFVRSDLTRASIDRASLAGARFGGSTLAELRGAPSLAGAAIDMSQLVPVALAVFASLGIVVDDDAADR